MDNRNNDLYEGGIVMIEKENITDHRHMNLTKGSFHRIVKPPEDCINDAQGIWVWGVGEPVHLLWYEFLHVEGSGVEGLLTDPSKVNKRKLSLLKHSDFVNKLIADGGGYDPNFLPRKKNRFA